MKFLFLIAILAFSFSANAGRNEAGNFGHVWCVQNKDLSPKVGGSHLTAQLKQTARYDYMLSVYKRTAGVAPQHATKLLFAVPVRVHQEDVLATFRNREAKVLFGIYLDEWDQSYLVAPGLKAYFVCSTSPTN